MAAAADFVNSILLSFDPDAPALGAEYDDMDEAMDVSLTYDDSNDSGNMDADMSVDSIDSVELEALAEQCFQECPELFELQASLQLPTQPEAQHTAQHVYEPNVFVPESQLFDLQQYAQQHAAEQAYLEAQQNSAFTQQYITPVSAPGPAPAAQYYAEPQPEQHLISPAVAFDLDDYFAQAMQASTLTDSPEGPSMQAWSNINIPAAVHANAQVPPTEVVLPITPALTEADSALQNSPHLFPDPVQYDSNKVQFNFMLTVLGPLPLHLHSLRQPRRNPSLLSPSQSRLRPPTRVDGRQPTTPKTSLVPSNVWHSLP
jgi:hypothetical protein